MGIREQADGGTEGDEEEGKRGEEGWEEEGDTKVRC